MEVTNLKGSIRAVARADQVYEVFLSKEGDKLNVIAKCLKDRNLPYLQDERILYQVVDSEHIIYFPKKGGEQE